MPDDAVQASGREKNTMSYPPLNPANYIKDLLARCANEDRSGMTVMGLANHFLISHEAYTGWTSCLFLET